MKSFKNLVFFSNNEVPLSQGYDDSFNQSLQNALFNLSKTGQKELIMSSQFREHVRYAINIWLLHSFKSKIR